MDEHSPLPVYVQDTAVARWTIRDTWLGLGLQICLMAATMFAMTYASSANTRLMLGVAVEALALLPIALVFAWRKISWRDLGFRKFEASALGIGCGLLVVAYVFIIAHNLIMLALGVMTQGDAIFKIFDELDSPFLFFFIGIIVAPLAEEMFFRGFLFKGFRQKYGWKAALLLSSLIFGLSHLQLAALIPTFLLGCVLAYVYHRTNSIFPGMILHFMINAFGLCAAFAAFNLRNGL
jgi:hypothetical protein